MWGSSYNVSPHTEVVYLKPFIAIVHVTHTHMHRCTCNLSQPCAVDGYVIVWYFCIHVFVSTSTLCACVPHVQCACTHKFILGVQFHSVNSLCVHVCGSTCVHTSVCLCVRTHIQYVCICMPCIHTQVYSRCTVSWCEVRLRH